jgi:PKD repeat protein
MNPTHTYSVSGSNQDYSVTLTVDNGQGGIDSTTKTVTVYNNPTADFSWTHATDDTETVEFTSQSSYASTYDWEFGDTATSTNMNPTHTYSVSGSNQDYSVTLTVDNGQGGIDSTTKTVTVYSNPTADFSWTHATDDTETVEFTSQSSYASTYDWEFGDTATSTNQNPSHTYTVSGANQDYSVTLTVDNGQGGIGSITKTVTVYSNPVVDFSWTHATDDTETVEFTDSSTYGSTYDWEFGDTATSTNQNPSHTYSVSGANQDYSVTLTVDNGQGGIGSITKTVTVYSNPTADFSWTHAIDDTETVDFTDSSTYGSTYDWEFGDTATSTNQNPTHTYSVSGANQDYSVTLTVDNGQGGIGSITKTVTIYSNPTADFSWTHAIDDTETVEFTDSSTYGSTYDWEFGDTATSTNQNPSHTYSVSGANQDYSVTLTVDNGQGGIGSITKTVTVYSNPVVDFTWTHATDDTETVEFTDSSTYGSTYDWEFGDTATSTNQNPTHTYPVSGANQDYSVTLTVDNGQGGIGSITKTVTVYNNPVVDFTWTHATDDTETVEFTDSSTYGSTYDWEFGDTATSTNQNPSHTYTVSGEYQDYSVTLTVDNGQGGIGSITKTVTVYNNPTADFSWTHATDDTETVDFTDSSTYGSTYDWEFGDTATSTNQNPTHTYSVSGANQDYSVTLTVDNGQGGIGSITKTVTVYNNPVVDFTWNYVTGDSETVDFTDSSTYGSTYDWEFGDTATSIDQNPTHTYSVSGANQDYSVTLTVDNGQGGIGSITKTVTVYSNPVVDFTWDYTTGDSETIDFTDSSTYGSSYNWEFGDTATSTNQNPSHTYTVSGEYQDYSVTLTVNNGQGGLGSATKTVTPYHNPIADFTSDYATNTMETIEYTDTSTYGSTYEWILDPVYGDTSTSQNPSHTYNISSTSRTIDVTLETTNIKGGIDIITKTVTVYNNPEIDFNFELDPEENQKVYFDPTPSKYT